MTLRWLIPLLLLGLAGFLWPASGTDGSAAAAQRAPTAFVQQSIARGWAQFGTPVERLSVRRVEVVGVRRLPRAEACGAGQASYQAELLARSWFNIPYASLSVDCNGVVLRRL